MLQKSREDVKEMNNEDAFYCSTVPLLLCLQWQKVIDLEGHSNFLSTVYSFSILYLEHHYCGDQQWRSVT